MSYSLSHLEYLFFKQLDIVFFWEGGFNFDFLLQKLAAQEMMPGEYLRFAGSPPFLLCAAIGCMWVFCSPTTIKSLGNKSERP